MTNNKRSPDFRYLYTNGVKIQFSPHDVMLYFGVKEDPSSADDALLEQIAVAMNPSTAKILAQTLTRTIEHFESATNTEIPVDKARLERLEEILASASARPKASSTS
jgi:Protein of unknown function (DUF3467)